MKRQELEKDKQETEQLSIILERKEFVLSVIRLLSCIIAFSMFVVVFQDRFIWALVIGNISLAIFLISMYQHSKVSKKEKIANLKIEVVTDILSRYSEEWKNLKETGISFSNTVDMFAFDLDIIGEASLYQYLCCAKTIQGKESLANLLLNHKNFKKTEIEERQGIMKELMSKQGFLINFMIRSYMYQYDSEVEEERVHGLLNSFTKQVIAYSKQEALIAKVLSVILPLVIALSISDFLPRVVLFFSVIISMIMYLRIFQRINQLFAVINPLGKSIASYQRMVEIIIQESFAHPKLKQMQAELKHSIKGLTKLDTIIGLFYLKQNPLVYGALNLFCLYDYHCLNQMKKWQENYGNNLIKWLDLIGDMEAYVSLSLPSLTKQKISFPTIVESEEIILEVQNSLHPLMSEDVAIGNHSNLHGMCYVITGSNMAGKTTFLRNLGVNLVLMHAGTVVCCDLMKATTMEVLTSMRVRDDVSTGVSTFYGELQRIEKMVKFSKTNQRGILLIDEIFKGTNLKDRIIGAKKTMEKLSSKFLITMITTHDEQLTTHETVAIENYHFEEYYKDNQIFFDYKIKEGPSTSTNAEFLMRMVGILD